MVGPAGRNGAGAHGVFGGEVPADNPREEFAKGGVGVGVGAAGQRDHGGEFGVAKSRARASQAGNYEGRHQRGARVVRAEPGKDENARANYGAYAKSGELDWAQGAFEAVLSGLAGL